MRCHLFWFNNFIINSLLIINTLIILKNNNYQVVLSPDSYFTSNSKYSTFNGKI